MDKLEKALEKARQARGTEVPMWQSSAPVMAAGSPHAPTLSNQELTASDRLPVEEEALEQNRILAHHTRQSEADIFRLLRTQILQVMNKNGFRSLAITSPNYGDGKTTIALNLAVSIAQDLKQTVLLVDLDLRKPSLHTYLGLNPEKGLTDYLVHGENLSDCLLRLSIDRLSILPAGNPLDKSSEVLASPKMVALAKEMKNRYPDRFIIYDMPPALEQDDPLAFLPQVDAVLMVVHDRKTPTSDVEKCLDVLKGANVIGSVLNNAE